MRKRSSSTSVTISVRCVARRRVEDGEEAARDEVEDPALVRRERAHVVLDVGRDDRVVVLDLRVVDDALSGSLSSFMTNRAAVAYSGISTSVSAVGLSCGTRSPER